VARLVCPHCGRNLPFPDHSGAVICDGCEQAFVPSKVHLRPASMPKRIAGWALLVVGLLLLVSAISAALKEDFRDRDFAMKLVGVFLQPAIAIFAGLNLKAGKLAVETSPSEPEADSTVS
jgi:hypothetical protein